MSVLKRSSSLNSILPDFFDQGISSTGGPAVVAVNETEKSYEVEIILQGFRKEDFMIVADRSILRVTARRELQRPISIEGEEGEGLGFASYSKSFNLPADCKDDEIQARYERGSLKLSIPKKDSDRDAPPATQIKIQ